ncbi:MAG: T9SS type A sorting domain-containing protein [Candidatus Symbiothrix sp.]|jgi:predicted alpha-1,6-mannanase (GH76 family)|nr:T9SS type A sorting domain-containing protein [Candidatus Symbiothrix sp.]
MGYFSGKMRMGLLFVFTIHQVVTYSQIPISTEAELRAISSDLTASYVLTNDISLTSDWTPIGKDSPFAGILDGNYHVIRNLKIKNPTSNYTGLFARTDNAVIQNLGIENAEVIGGTSTTTGNFVGILAGMISNSTIQNVYIANSRVEGQTWVGSFAGRINGAQRSSVIDCYSTATVVAKTDNAGGIFGSAEKTTIKNAYFSGTAETPDANTGGIIGMSLGGDTIANCLVLSQSLKGGTVGRMVGKEGGTLTLRNNYARTDLLIGKGNASGLVVPVAESYARGKQGENVPYDASPEYVSGFPHYTEASADAAFKAFNQHYLSPTQNIYRAKYNKEPVAAVWTQAIFLDMAVNAYKRTNSEEYLALLDRLFKGNKAEYADFIWTVDRYPNGWFIFDDIMWWVISLARLHEITGDETYLNLSVSGFDRVWNGANGKRGSYDPVNGGMYWNWTDGDGGKMACINYPTVIAAMTLYNITKDEVYLDKAKEIYAWAKINLFDATKGRVADSNHGGGPAWTLHTYNQATCMGAAVMLYKETGDKEYLEEAVITANYLKNQMSTEGILPFETGIEQGIYNAIFAQYIIRLIEDGEQYQYLPWLHYNLDNAWGYRNKSSNITDTDHSKQAPVVNDIESYNASGIPALMQVISPVIETGKEIHCKSKTFYEKNLGWDMENTWVAREDAFPLLNFSQTTGIEKISTAENPFNIVCGKGSFFLQAPAESPVEVYQPTGVLVKKQLIQNINTGVELPSGIYIVRAVVGGKAFAKKIVI